MRFPNGLKKGDKVGIIAPSCSANVEYIDTAIKNIEALGLNVVEGKNIRNTKYLVSGLAKDRAGEFLDFFLDDDIKYIFSARGGEFLVDILPIIHERKELLKNVKNIKYFHGYSDNSLLNMYLTTNYSIPTVNSANVTDFCMDKFHKSIQNIVDLMFLQDSIKFIQNNFTKYQIEEFEDKEKGYNLTEKVEYKILDENTKAVKIKGRLLGGCLETIIQLIGTDFDNVSKFCKNCKEGVIWYIDIYEDNAPEVYRKLNHMKNASWFKNLKGVLIGRTYGGEAFDDFDLKYAFKKALSDLNVPVIYDVDIGHVAPQLTLVNGSLATVTYENNNFEIIQEFI